MQIIEVIKKEYLSTIGIVLLFIVVVTLSFLSASFIDEVFYTGIFQKVRVLYDYTTAAMPFANFYLLLSVLLFLLVRFVVLFRKSNHRLKYLIFPYKFLGFLSWIFVLFYVLWGFNYRSPNLKAKLNIELNEINSQTVYSEGVRIAQLLNEIRLDVRYKVMDMNDDSIYLMVENDIRDQQKGLLKSWFLPNNGNVRVRPIYPKGVLLRFSTAGVFLPYIGEGQIDAGLHHLTWPSTIAHEMAHGFGITDEGECNFVSLLTCIKSDNKYIRYSGFLMYFRYLSSSLYSDKKLFKELYNNLSEEVKMDLDSIRKELDKYPDILPNIRNWIYDQFLKSNGVKVGIKSYGTLINLAINYGIDS